MVSETKKKVIFNDKALKLFLKSEIERRYSVLIISFLTKENLHSLENNLVSYKELPYDFIKDYYINEVISKYTNLSIDEVNKVINKDAIHN